MQMHRESFFQLQIELLSSTVVPARRERFFLLFTPRVYQISPLRGIHTFYRDDINADNNHATRSADSIEKWFIIAGASTVA